MDNECFLIKLENAEIELDEVKLRNMELEYDKEIIQLQMDCALDEETTPENIDELRRNYSF